MLIQVKMGSKLSKNNHIMYIIGPYMTATIQINAARINSVQSLW